MLVTGGFTWRSMSRSSKLAMAMRPGTFQPRRWHSSTAPMAISVTDFYVRHREDHKPEFVKEENSGERDPLNVHEVHMMRSVEDSKKINQVNTPCIIVSASGMATGGRVLRVDAGQRSLVLAGCTARPADVVAASRGAREVTGIIAAGSESARLPGFPDDPRVIDSTGALELPPD